MKKTSGAAAFAAALFLMSSFPALAVDAPAAPLAAEPGFAEMGALPDPMPLRSLIEAAILASGIEAGRRSAYVERIDGLLDALAATIDAKAAQYGEAGDSAPDGPAPDGPPNGEYARGEAVLAFLHDTVFFRYEADATTLDLALDMGRYNCVSSALIYMIAARSVGLEVRGVKTSDHAFCVLAAGSGGRDIDIETTNRYGFDPGNKKEFKDSFGRVTGYAYSPPGNYARRDRVADGSFVGLVLSNRAGLFERSGRYAEALRLGADMDALAPGPESRAFLLDRVNNVAAELSKRGDYAGARALADRARAELGGSSRLVELSLNAAMGEAVALAQAGRWNEALDEALIIAADALAATVDERAEAAARRELGSLVEACVGNLANGFLQASDFPGARALVAARRGLLEATAGARAVEALERRIAEAEFSDAVARLPFAEALAAADRALASGAVARARWEEAAAYLYGSEANRLAAAGDLLAAAAAAEAGAARAPGKAGPLKRFAADLRRAFAANSHNEFARLYNAGDYAAALASIRAAIALQPGDPTLKADLAAALEAAP